MPSIDLVLRPRFLAISRANLLRRCVVGTFCFERGTEGLDISQLRFVDVALSATPRASKGGLPGGLLWPRPIKHESYSQEELVAEMGPAFLCGQAGIVERTLDNSASYVHSWLQRLKDDRKLVIYAAAQAQKAADFILNEQPAEGLEAAA